MDDRGGQDRRRVRCWHQHSRPPHCQRSVSFYWLLSRPLSLRHHRHCRLLPWRILPSPESVRIDVSSISLPTLTKLGLNYLSSVTPTANPSYSVITFLTRPQKATDKAKEQNRPLSVLPVFYNPTHLVPYVPPLWPTTLPGMPSASAYPWWLRLWPKRSTLQLLAVGKCWLSSRST